MIVSDLANSILLNSVWYLFKDIGIAKKNPESSLHSPENWREMDWVGDFPVWLILKPIDYF